MDSLRSIQDIQPVVPAEPIQPSRGPDATDFAAILQNTIRMVEGSGSTASKAVDDFISGRGGELHSTLLATQRASLQFELFLQMKNKVVQAYQEIMRTQI